MTYTADQMQWCEREEFNIWTFFLENNLLYETESRKVDKYVHEAPTSSVCPRISRKYRLVDRLAYCGQLYEKKSELSLEALIQMKDGQQILQASATNLCAHKNGLRCVCHTKNSNFLNYFCCIFIKKEC
ncbi:MAG: hypothetical protein IPL35_04560 [Sphingobacteriales bacterium]|nr:hypothetical protein [Sphingobacteriales bacterium]